MEEYAEELRTPPVSLVSIVGCSELHQAISGYLHTAQPPINTLALPDFSKIPILARKHRDPLDPGRPPAGILKRDWLAKHRTRAPAAVAVLLAADRVTGDPAQWLQVCTDLDNLKAVIHGRSSRLVVVIVQTAVTDDVTEDLMVALRKRAEIESKYLIMFNQNNASELKQSLNRLAGIFAELCNSYYREEGRRIKTRIEKKNFNAAELNIRYCFKVAVYAEFRRDWAEALKFYEDAYTALREIVRTSTRLPPIQRLVEIKAVAEQLHFKVSTLLLHGGKFVEAIAWFHKHIASYERLVGAPEVAFLHWEWFSKQFLVFAELLETSSAAIPSTFSANFGTSENPLTEWEFQPAYYYQFSAHYLTEKKYYLARTLSMKEHPDLADAINGCPESVIPSLFIGQYARLFEQGDTAVVLPLSDAEYTGYAIAEGERFQDSFEIIALFRRSFESFDGLKAPRVASYCCSLMAREYFEAEDFTNAKQHFDSVARLYRLEGWVTLLWESLGYLRECSRKLGLAKEFAEYSLEMAALPVLPNAQLESTEGKGKYGPADPATLRQRERIQEEVFSLATKHAIPSNMECSLNVTNDQPLCLEVDLISPLRVVLLSSVAFHEQSVKPASSTLITLSLLSHLPLPFEVDQLEIQFNQSACNFTIVKAQDLPTAKSGVDDQGTRLETAPSLTLETHKWLRFTYEISSGQSGKLECLAVTAKIGPCFMICCRAESPASMEELPMWKFEDVVETFPMRDPGLTFSGQKVIQVEEPEPLVDLILNSCGPALVGENFLLPVIITSKGHEVHSGELKINLVDARGDGLLMSPRADVEPFSSTSHDVELLSISKTADEDESQLNLDSIKKIQHSFGVVSVPQLGVGESWSCNLEIKWHRPKSVMLYVSLGYSPSLEDTASQRVNVHRSLQIEGRTPVIINHRFLMPFRREPLLVSKVKPSTDFEQKVSLPLNEMIILIVSARNCTEVPLRLISMTVESNAGGSSCSVQHTSGTCVDHPVLVEDDEFKQVFSVLPRGDYSSFNVGTICVMWRRDSDVGPNPDSGVLTRHKLPDVNLEFPPLVISMECPPHAILGVPFSFYVRVQNLTSLLQEIKYSLGDSQSFVFSGPHSSTIFILPNSDHIISYKLVPLGSGAQQLPRISLTSVRYSAALQPSAAASTLFVFPSDPAFRTEGMRKESDSISE